MNPSAPSVRRKAPGLYLGLGWLVAGACFLFDPFVSVFDLLPDALGYLFVFIGLYRLSDLNERLADAARGARNLALLGLARQVALLLAFGFVSASEQPVFILVVLFSLGVLDAIILWPFWQNLCGGLLYLGSRHDGVALFDRRGRGGKERRRNITERYAAFSTVWFLAREVLAVLPELTVLTHESGGVELGEGTVFYEFVGLFRGTAALVGLAMGIVWLIFTIRFARRLRGDKPFFETLREKYCREVLVREDLFAMRAVRGALTCLVVAAVFGVDFYLDGVNILPDFLSAAMLLLSLFFLRKYLKGTGFPPAVSVAGILAYAAASAVCWVNQLTGVNIDETLDAVEGGALFDGWLTAMGLQALSGILFLAALAVTLIPIWRLVRRYTALSNLHEDPRYATERTAAIHRTLRVKLWLVLGFAAVTVVSTLWHWGVVPHMAAMPIDPTFNAVVIILIEFITEAYWMIDLLVAAVFAGVTAHATGAVNERLEYSYLMK